MKLTLRILIFTLLTAFFLVLLGGTVQGLVQSNVLPADTFLIFLPQWAPGLAGLLLLLIFRKDGHRITFVDRTMPPVRYLWLILAPALAGLLAYTVALTVFAPFTGTPITATVLLAMLLGAFGEELGWRGYLQPRLLRQLNGFWAAVITGLLWTLIHIHIFTGGPLFVGVMALAFVAYSLMLHALLADAKYNLLGATVFHLAVNLVSTLSFSLLLDLNLGFAIVYTTATVLVAAVLVYLRRDLFFTAPLPTTILVTQ